MTIETATLVSTQEAARRLNVSTRWILQLVDAKVLPAIQVMGRKHPQRVFRIEDVAALVKARRANQKADGAR